MADETTPPGPPGGPQRPPQQPQTPRPPEPRVNVSQEDARGNPVDSTLQEGLKNLASTSDRQQKTLGKMSDGIDKVGRLLEDLPKQLEGAISGSRGEKKQGGGDVSTAMAAYKANLNDMVRYGEPLSKEFLSIPQAIKTMKEKGLHLFEAQLMDLKKNLVEMGGEFSSGTTALKAWRLELRKTTEESKSGLGSIITAIKSDLFSGGQAFHETIDTIRKDIDQGGVAWQLAGQSVSQYGVTLKKVRGDLQTQSGGLYARMDFKEQNQFIQQMNQNIAAQTGISRIDSTENERRYTSTFKLFEQTARNTGKSVQELMKMNESVPDINELVARGSMSKETSDKLIAASNSGILNPDQFKAVLQSYQYGNANVAAGMSGNPVEWLTTGKAESTQYIHDALESGRAITNQLASEAGAVARRNERVSGLAANVLIPLSNHVFSGNRLNQAKRDTGETGANVMVEEFFRRWDAWFADHPLFQRLVELTSGISGLVSGIVTFGGMFLAHGKALMSNTTALYSLGEKIGMLEARMRGGGTGLPGGPNNGPGGKNGINPGLGGRTGFSALLLLDMFMQSGASGKKSPEDFKKMQESNENALKGVLGITPEREKAWDDLQKKIRDMTGLTKVESLFSSKDKDKPKAEGSLGDNDKVEGSLEDMVKAMEDLKPSIDRMTDHLEKISKNTKPPTNPDFD